MAVAVWAATFPMQLFVNVLGETAEDGSSSRDNGDVFGRPGWNFGTLDFGLAQPWAVVAI